MMRLLRNGILSLFILAASLILAFAAINWRDEPLRPEVQAALEWKVPEHAFEDNGYLINLGMDEPSGQDAAAVGKQKLESELARYQAYLQTHTGEVSTLPSYSISTAIRSTHSLCDYQKYNCVEFYLAQDKHKQATLLKEYAFLIERLSTIRQSKNYVEVVPPYLYVNLPMLGDLFNAAELERIQSIADISKGNMQAGINRIVENALFSRRLLKESNSLTTHQIALGMVKKDMRFLSELLAKYPELTRYHELLSPVTQPISGPEYSLSKAFQFSRQYTSNFLRDAPKQESDGTLFSENGIFMNTVGKYGFKPGASTNLAYDTWEIWIKLATSDPGLLDASMAQARQERERLFGTGYADLYYVRNPFGKILLKIAEPVYMDYIFRQHDTDGYVRLVAMQFKLIAEHIPAAGIPDALEKSGPEFRNPYTLKPMQWDAAASQLRFEGRQPDSENPGKNKTYSVTIPQGNP
jgi:hypothetical protein